MKKIHGEQAKEDNRQTLIGSVNVTFLGLLLLHFLRDSSTKFCHTLLVSPFQDWTSIVDKYVLNCLLSVHHPDESQTMAKIKIGNTERTNWTLLPFSLLYENGQTGYFFVASPPWICFFDIFNINFLTSGSIYCTYSQRS